MLIIFGVGGISFQNSGAGSSSVQDSRICPVHTSKVCDSMRELVNGHKCRDEMSQISRDLCMVIQEGFFNILLLFSTFYIHSP